MAQAQLRRPVVQANKDRVRKYVNAEPWLFYDTRLFGTGIIPPDTVAVNFAQFVSPLQFYQPRSVGIAGYPLTNMNDTGKMEADFAADYISIDVFCDTDAPSAPGLSTSQEFAECIINYCVIKFDFGSVTKFVAPVIKFPGGGGLWTSTKVRTQAMAANSDSGNSNNGVPAASAKRKLPEPIFFERGSVFTCQILCDTNPASTSTQARIQAIQPLTGLFKAGIRVTLEGVRGSPMLSGTARNWVG